MTIASHIDSATASMLNNGIADIAERVREHLNQHNVPDFKLTVMVEGRTSADLKFEINLNGMFRFDNAVKGTDIRDVVDEFVRRDAYNRENEALKLPRPGSSDKAPDREPRPGGE